MSEENDEVEIGETGLEKTMSSEETTQEPKVNMIFNTVDEVLDFYKKYANRVGFPMKKRSSKKGDCGELKYVTLSCSRSGIPQSTASNVLKPYPSIKCNCKAQLRAGICLDGRWKVNSVKLDHNHGLNPNNARYFRMNRAISSYMKRKIEVNDRAGIRVNKNYNSMVVEAGEHENMSFMEKDCRNYINKVRRLQLGEGDATAIQKYFLKMQAQNANFFYAIDLDESGRLRNVFWADSRSRAAYEEFGDAITFDTTYLTNKYDMPFAPFVGVNHHGHSILLGCGLISSEDTDTFVWLFKVWLACMSGLAPCGIITYQDRAMKNAIEIVFPNTRHRWCLWHIMKKLHEKLKSYKHYESIKFALENIVYDSLTNIEFEDRWKEMIEKYELQSNDWLRGLYDERRRWVPSFVKGSFWAGMSTTQRSESMNAFFDDHVNSKTTLKQFVEQYENALMTKVEKENQADYKSSSADIQCSTHYFMEKQAQGVYTIAKFKEFQNELTGKMYCEVVDTKEDGVFLKYQISEDMIIAGKKKSVNFTVIFHEFDSEVKCNCSKFEFRGILCRHAIYVLIKHKMDLIPDKYILRRWRKDVTRRHTKIKISYNESNATLEAHQCDKMQKTFDEIKELAADSEEKCVIVMAWMQKLKEQLSNHDNVCGSTQPIPKSPTGRSFDNCVNEISNSKKILTLLAVRSKG
ncbi:protein FAR-RED IMPAIRED RESPONSE 1-like [Prunus dulcis]|uniref:protein FAR-RED IMPAIRED RESPONSE 1-like n=1 Tax=Prunus dulcis TaxID=3755 RepID=UPI0014822C7B|nr:protein FAR-RED IMPAIRED RESPONSE 1-like [Prunus dulcis]